MNSAGRTFFRWLLTRFHVLIILMCSINPILVQSLVKGRLLICVLCMFFSGAVPAQEEVIKEFLAFYFASYRGGTPDAGQIALLDKSITPAFRKRLMDANAAELCHAKRVNNTEPPLLEGDLFTSLFEGATDGKIAAVRVDGGSAEVDVEWSYDAEGVHQEVVWQDRFYLVSRAGAWLIDDISHLGEWEFSYHGRISQLLLDIAGQCRDGAD